MSEKQCWQHRKAVQEYLFNEPAGPVFSRTMKVNVKLAVGVLWVALVFFSCGDDGDRFPPPDVSSIPADVTLLRFDRDLMAIDTNASAASALQKLDDKYGTFAFDYFRHIIPVRRGDFGPEDQQDILRAFIRYPLVQELSARAQEKFTDEAMADQQEKLEQALRYYRYYLPQAPLPDTVVTFISQLQYAGFLYGDGQLALGLDFYIGPEFSYQSVDAHEAIFSDYLALSYTPEHMTGKAMRMLIEDYAADAKPRAGRLVDHLLFEGKKLFLLDRVLPNVADHVLQEVTAEQMEWLASNETAIYAQLQTDNKFYSTDPTLIRKLTQPAPSSQGMPVESPGQAVNYLGKKIVESYMLSNPGTTVAELFAIEDGQKILAGARYKPR